MDINDIIVGDRQRKAEIDDQFVSSVARQLIQPIVLRRTDEGPTLVAGARRLLALKKLGTQELIENKHFLFLENLSPEDAEIIELEENIKREELSWRDHVRALVKIHELLKKKNPSNSIKNTANELSVSEKTIWNHLSIHRRLDHPILKDAKGINHAISILQVEANRASGDIVQQLASSGSAMFLQGPPSSQAPIPSTQTEKPKDSAPVETQEPPKPTPVEPNLIECASFLTWLEDYRGPKFNLIHCDFPYSIDYKNYGTSINNSSEDYDFKGFFELLDAFRFHLDKFCSYQAHIIFWFSMEFYERTRIALSDAGLSVQKHPLVWFKSDNSGIIPGQNTYPRRVYETAFLCSRGERPLVKPLANLYAAPLPANSIHPSQKPEPMLKHFLGMLIDQTTDVFDPTCGSGSALRAADSLGARSILGLELNRDYANRANAATIQARKMRRIQL